MKFGFIASKDTPYWSILEIHEATSVLSKRTITLDITCRILRINQNSNVNRFKLNRESVKLSFSKHLYSCNFYDSFEKLVANHVEYLI